MLLFSKTTITLNEVFIILTSATITLNEFAIRGRLNELSGVAILMRLADNTLTT